MRKYALCLIAGLLVLSACDNLPGTSGTSSETGETSTETSSIPADGYDAKNGLNADKTEVLDRRDQKKYPVIKIGEQYWMAQNLNFESEASTASETPNAGRVYTWTDLMNGAASSDKSPSGVQGLCPSGWHIPSDTEWQAMEQSLGMSAEQAAATGGIDQRGAGFGDKLKSSSGWFESKNGNNESGFNALPGGVFDSVFAYVGEETHYWTATEHIGENENIEEAWSRYLTYEHSGVERGFNLQNLGYFARCILD